MESMEAEGKTLYVANCGGTFLIWNPSEILWGVVLELAHTSET